MKTLCKGLCFVKGRCKGIQGPRLDQYLFTTILLYTVPWRRREMLAGQDWLESWNKRNAGAACHVRFACNCRFAVRFRWRGAPGGGMVCGRVYMTWNSKLVHLSASSALAFLVELSMKRDGSTVRSQHIYVIDSNDDAVGCANCCNITRTSSFRRDLASPGLTTQRRTRQTGFNFR
jgi:hypothetical protein